MAVLLVIATVVSQSAAQVPPPNGRRTTATSPQETEVEGCLDRHAGKFVLTQMSFYVTWNLAGRTAELEGHVGDYVKVRGIAVQPPVDSTKGYQPGTLQFASVEVMVHKNPEGVRPIVGSVDSWPSYVNAEYGLRLRYPATFVGNAKSEASRIQSNFAGQGPASSVQLFSASIPQNVYPDSNFVDGGFAVFINPNIHSAGTCNQFRIFWPQYTSSMTVSGIEYAHTLDVGVAMGTAYSGYTFHTFHNGLCYEFDFNFAESSGGGLDFPCATQWVSEDNHFELMKGALSQVSFSTPEFKPVPVASPTKKEVPAVVSFEHSPLDFNGVSTNI